MPRRNNTTRRRLIDTTVLASAALVAAGAWTHSIPTLAAAITLFTGAGIAQFIENRLNTPHGPQVPTDAPDRDREDWLSDGHPNQHHDEEI